MIISPKIREMALPRPWWLLTAAVLLAGSALAEPPQARPGSQFVGTAECAGCHQQQYQDWLGSHHELAMQRATEQTVLGDFEDARFLYNGIESRFFAKAMPTGCAPMVLRESWRITESNTCLVSTPCNSTCWRCPAAVSMP